MTGTVTSMVPISARFSVAKEMWIWGLFLASLTIVTTVQQLELTVPSAPSRVNAMTSGCDSIQVSWDAVSLNGTLLDTYVVFYYGENSANFTKMITVTELQTELRSLNRSTLYTISVAAIVNSDIVGTLSSEIQNTTFGAVKPTRLRVDSVTNHSAILSWNIDHPNIGCNGKETQFRVRYRLTNDDALQRFNVRETSVELTDLLPFTNYTVFIDNIDTSGLNHRSDDFLFTSLPGVPSAPMNITTVTNNSVPTQLLITWHEPLILNGVVSHYDVEYSEQGLSPLIAHTSDTELFVTGLNPSAVYVVRVRANNHAKLDLNGSNVISGLFTNVTTVRLPDPLPAPPGHPRNFNVTHSVFYGTTIELKFSWEPPSTGDPVDSYWIRCNKSVADDDGISSGFIITGGVVGVVIIMIIVLCAIMRYKKNLRKLCNRKKPLNHFYDQVFYHRTKVNTGKTVDDIKAHASLAANVTKLNDENIYDVISIKSQYDPANDTVNKDPTTAYTEPTGEAKYGDIYQPQCEDHSFYQDPSYNTVVDQDPSYDPVVHQNASYDPVVDQEPTTAHAELISKNKYGVINQPRCDDPTFADQDSTLNVFKSQYDPTCDAIDKDPTTTHTELTGEAKYGVINQPQCDSPNFDTIDQYSGHDTVVDQDPNTVHTEIFSENKYGVVNQPRCGDPAFADQGRAYNVIIQSQSDLTCDTIATTAHTKLAGEAKYGVINQPRCDDLNFDTIDQDRDYDAVDQEPTIAYTDKVKSSIIDQQKCTFVNQDPPTTVHTKPTGEENYGVINQPQCNDPSANTVDPDPATKSSPRLTDQGKTLWCHQPTKMQ